MSKDQNIDLKNNKSILADTLESLLGAIFIDGGFNESKKFVKLYSSYLSILLTELDSNSVAKCIDHLEEAREKNNTIFVNGQQI